MVLEHFRRRGWILVAGVAALAAARAETIGPHRIEAAPTAAVLVSGGGAPSSWLHVVNVPVTIHEALTGFSLIDDGWGNLPSGTTLLLTFAPGTLRNGPGPDLVLLDAGDDLNVYLVATSHDGSRSSSSRPRTPGSTAATSSAGRGRSPSTCWRERSICPS